MIDQPSLTAVRNAAEHLPLWHDGRPALWIFYSTEEGGDIIKGCHFNDPVDAYMVAQWLVEAGLVYCAWVVGALTTGMMKQ